MARRSIANIHVARPTIGIARRLALRDAEDESTRRSGSPIPRSDDDTGTHDAHVEPLAAVVTVNLRDGCTLTRCVADFKGTDVDQPRNLAKTVTVE